MTEQELRALQEAYLEVYQELDEAEGSYGQTPKATAAYGKLANKRRETPASGFAKRGDKTKQVKSAEKHHYRTLNPDAGNRGKKSTKPFHTSGGRKGMTQSDRDYARGADEYGHTGYDPDGDGPASGPGGKPKGKKLERQKKTGVSAESFDLFDYILEHLVSEGYADTNEAAIAIMANMSEEWRQDIVEGKKQFPHKKVDRQVYDAMDSGETAGDSGNRAKETRDYARADKMRSVAAKHGGKTRA
jgi:hypothetical protein